VGRRARRNCYPTHERICYTIRNSMFWNGWKKLGGKKEGKTVGANFDSSEKGTPFRWQITMSQKEKAGKERKL